MLLARRGLPGIGLIAVTLLGGALAAASANTLNCYLDRDIDAIMKRTSRRPLVAKGDSGGGQARRGAGVRHPAWRRVNGAARPRGELAVSDPGRRRDPVLRLRLHDGAEAPDGVQHRDRRRGRLLPGARRLGSGDRNRELAGHRAVRHHLLLDAAALLGAGDEVQGRLRVGRGTHAAGGSHRRHRSPARSWCTPTSWWP